MAKENAKDKKDIKDGAGAPESGENGQVTAGPIVDGDKVNEGGDNGAGEKPVETLIAPEAPAKNGPALSPAQQEELDKKNGVVKSAKKGPLVQLEILSNALVGLFKENGESSLPGLTEKDVRAFAEPSAKGIEMRFVFVDDEKRKGYITLHEFDKEVRVPSDEAEFFSFGFDYSAGK